MKRTSAISTFVLCLAIGWTLMSPTAAAQPPSWTAAELEHRVIERRAVEAAIWGMPIVSVDAMREAFFRDAGASYGDILYFSKPADWKFQTTTPNASSLYVYFNFNTKDGPVVLEFPAAVGAGLFGTLLDAWQTPLVDVGPRGRGRRQGRQVLAAAPGLQGRRARRLHSRSEPRPTTATHCSARSRRRNPTPTWPRPLRW